MMQARGLHKPNMLDDSHHRMDEYGVHRWSMQGSIREYSPCEQRAH